MNGGRVVKSLVDVPSVPHSADLLKNIAAFLSSENLAPADVSGVLYCNGPGSFTSLRIGLATLQGMFAGREGNFNFLTCSSLLFRCVGVRIRHGGATAEVIMRAGRGRAYHGFLDGGVFFEKLVSRSEEDDPTETPVEAQAFAEILARESWYVMSPLNQARLNYLQEPDIG
jgi:tRNA A37 threonylcarbamoyladenosine modification protein TsaB